MPDSPAGRLRRTIAGMGGFVLLALLWELYKVFGRSVDDRVFGWRLPAHTDRASMPHVWDVLIRFTEPEVRDRPRRVFSAVASGTWYTFRLATIGLLVGLAVGLGLAVLMQRFKVLERAWLPYIVLSQTVPLIALAPLVVGWGSNWHIGAWAWERWMSVSALAAYLAFFPVAVGALRGLQSPKPHAVELMDSYAASWWQTLYKLRLPAAVPYLLPALRLAAAAAIVGTIVAEISAGVAGGVGRLILDYFQRATGDPSQVFTAFVGAALLGLGVAGLLAMLESFVMRYRPKELA